MRLFWVSLVSLVSLFGSAACAAPLEVVATVDRVVPEEARFYLADAELVRNGTQTPLPTLKSATVSAGDLKVGYEGKRVRGQLEKTADGYRLDFIWPANEREETKTLFVTQQLRSEQNTKGGKIYLANGDFLPEFALYDQFGELRGPDDFKGKPVVLNFIFTRCQMATMCPASTARMVRLQRDLASAGNTDTQLVTISFDPEYDTPGVLHEYGLTRGMDFSNFSLLTGQPEQVERLMRAFGVLVMPDQEEIINHTMTTLLFNADGRLVFRKNGSRWSSEEFVERIQKL